MRRWKGIKRWQNRQSVEAVETTRKKETKLGDAKDRVGSGGPLDSSNVSSALRISGRRERDWLKKEAIALGDI